VFFTAILLLSICSPDYMYVEVETSLHSPIYSIPWPYGVVLIVSTGVTITWFLVCIITCKKLYCCQDSYTCHYMKESLDRTYKIIHLKWIEFTRNLTLGCIILGEFSFSGCCHTEHYIKCDSNMIILWYKSTLRFHMRPRTLKMTG